eukprot:1969417-Lingulodinium_polyedra.AAC.1
MCPWREEPEVGDISSTCFADDLFRRMPANSTSQAHRAIAVVDAALDGCIQPCGAVQNKAKKKVAARFFGKGSSARLRQ